MKKLLLVFIILCTTAYSNLITSNGKISLYFDKEDMRIQSIRGDVFGKEDISILDIGVVISGKSYGLKDYVKNAVILPNTNIISITSEVGETEFRTFVFPSSFEKKKLYVNTFVMKGDEEITMIYRVHLYNSIKALDYDKPYDYYEIDDFRVKSKNNPMGMYISKTEFLNAEALQEVREEIIAYQDDKVLFASEIVNEDKNKSDILIFNFEDGKWDNKLDFNPSYLKDEYEFWQEWGWEFQNYPKEVQEQLVQLRMITMDEIIPSTLSYVSSGEDFTTNLKLSEILSDYEKSKEAFKIIENYRFKRKNTPEDLAVMFSLFKSWEYSKEFVSDEYIRKIILPIINRILDGIDDDGVFLIDEDSIEVYYNLITLFRGMLELSYQFEYIPEEKIREKLEKIMVNVQRNYITPVGLKDRPTSLEINPKNIRYIELYPKEIREGIILDEFDENFDRRSGFLKYEDSTFIDIDYNLEFAKLLYSNGEEKLAERLFTRLKELIEKNDNYISPKMHPIEKNEVEIYGDLIYLYLKTNYFRGIE